MFRRFSRWSDKEVWQTLFATLAQEADFEEVFMEGTIVRAHQHAAGASQKRRTESWPFSWGMSTKIHTLVDGLGNPVRFILSGGNRHDFTEASNLLKDLQVGAVIADKAFDSGDLLKLIASMQAQAIIPPRATTLQPRPFDQHRHKARNLIERFFARIKQFRRIATRYDKLPAATVPSSRSRQRTSG